MHAAVAAAARTSPSSSPSPSPGHSPDSSPDPDPASTLTLIRRGADLSLTPGGFEEATLSSGGAAERVYVTKRAGFLKYCLEHGVSVCPVYAFGEKHLYANAQAQP